MAISKQLRFLLLLSEYGKQGGHQVHEVQQEIRRETGQKIKLRGDDCFEVKMYNKKHKFSSSFYLNVDTY